MRIIDSIMPVNDIVALAANGQRLRISVTKTSAQGKAAQNASPNLMSFSTDENSVWFNAKKYGMHMFNTGLVSLSTSSSHADIASALNGATFSDIKDFVNRGVICAMVTNKGSDFELCPVSISYTDSSGEKSAYFVITTETKTLTEIQINMASPSAYKVVSSSGYVILHNKDIINNLTTTDTSKVLSAAQGKVLNDRISSLGNAYRVKGTKANIEEVYGISASAKLGDVWNITSAFTIGGKPYPANTNVVCIAEWSTSTTPQNNWDPLGGTVDLSTYLSKNDASSTYATKSELNSHTGNKNNPHGVTKSQVGLGNVTNDAQVKKTDVVGYNLAVKVPSTSQVPSTEAFAQMANYAEMFPVSFDTIEAGEKTIVSSSTTIGGGTIVWLSTMKKFAYKGTDGKYYNNWAISGSPNPAFVNAGLVKQEGNSPIPGKVYIHDSGVYFSTGTGLVLVASKDSPIIIE